MKTGKAAHIAAHLRDDPVPGQIADMEALTRGSKRRDARQVRKLIALAREAGTTAKRNGYLKDAWTHAVLFNEAMLAKALADKATQKLSKAGATSGKKKTAEAKLWQAAIRPEVIRLLDAGKDAANIGALLAPKTATKRKPARAPRTVARFVAEVQLARPKK